VLRAGADVTAVREALQKHPDVERVDFKRLARADSIPNDPNYAQQWAPAITGLETAWDVPGRGRIRVAVIDTGVQMAHPEFAGRIVWEDGYADFDSGEAPTSGSSFDHGTHVAGIIAAARNNNVGVAGYSNDIDLMVLNCAEWDDDDNEWKISDADDAMDDAVAAGAQVINCSFGFNDDIEDEVEDAYDHSVLVVHSAGNSMQSIAGHWEVPSIATFTVSALMSSGTPATDVFDASYSNFGPGIDLAAPGTAIHSTVPGGYGNMQGTSMAAPQVSGAAALIMSMNPALIGDESATNLLIRMAADKGPAGYDNQYGWGALRLKREVLQACRDATTFVCGVSTAPGEGGNFDRPWRTIAAALNAVPNGSTLILNGGTDYAAVYRYPPITITKPCVLSVIPDRPAVIGE
jgi:subtilisin family serine protease